MTTTVAEARLQPRVPFRDAVNVVASASSPPLRLRALNLSEGGLCLQTNHPFRRGDRVGVRLCAGGVDLSIPITEVAWVVREVPGSSRIPAVGLRFINLRPPHRLALKQAIHALSDASLPPLSSPQPGPALAGVFSHEVPVRSQQPSLAPLSGQSTVPPPAMPTARAAKPKHALPENGPSLAPLSPAQAAPEEWTFSQEPVSGRPTRVPWASPSLALAGGLLVVGTLAGVIFGVLDQRGQPTPAPVAAVEPAPPAPQPEPPTAAPAPAPAVAAPAPKPVAAAPATLATAAPSARGVVVPPSLPVQKAVPPAKEKAPLPSVRPGHIALGAITANKKELIVPIRGVQRVEKTFVLHNPERVVVDLEGVGFEGPAEGAGFGRVQKVRMGKRPGGVRMVLDVKDAKVAKSARVERRQGVTAVVFPLSP